MSDQQQPRTPEDLKAIEEIVKSCEFLPEPFRSYATFAAIQAYERKKLNEKLTVPTPFVSGGPKCHEKE